jgi:hypothetical protein
MNANLPEDLHQDAVALSVARVLARANVRAREMGFEAEECHIHLSQEGDGDQWRVNYGPKSPAGRRGGDLIIDIDPASGTITRVMRGQ